MHEGLNWKHVYLCKHVAGRLHEAIQTVKPPRKADWKVCIRMQRWAPDPNLLVHSTVVQPGSFTWLDHQLSRPNQYPDVDRQLSSLQKRGLDIHYSGAHGTLLMKAIRWGRPKAVKYLVEMGIELTAQDIGTFE